MPQELMWAIVVVGANVALLGVAYDGFKARQRARAAVPVPKDTAVSRIVSAISKASDGPESYRTQGVQERTPEVPVRPRSERGESLLQSECEHIMKTSRCPDCETGVLLKGPEGGICMNVLCEQCGARFNLSMMPELLFSERL